MADTADRILDDLRRRRDELRPLVDELKRIDAAIDALERASGDRKPGAATTSRVSTGTMRRRGRPRKGEPNRTDQFLSLVRAGGISIPAAADELGIGPNYLYRIAATLEREGTIRKKGREYVIAVEEQPSEGAEVIEEPEIDTGGDEHDLVTEEGVNEGAREVAEE